LPHLLKNLKSSLGIKRILEKGNGPLFVGRTLDKGDPIGTGLALHVHKRTGFLPGHFNDRIFVEAIILVVSQVDLVGQFHELELMLNATERYSQA